MKLITFYKKILKSMGMETDKGFIKMKSTSGDSLGDELVMIDGKPLVLPLKEQLENIQTRDENGNFVITKVLFNPLRENLVTGDSKALNKLKNVATLNASLALYIIGELLLTVAETNNVKEASLEVQNFLTKLNEARTPHIKNLVDEKTINLWSELFNKSLSSGTPFIKLFLKKGVQYQGEKFNRGLVITSPMLEEMKNGEFLDIKLRNKDMKIFIILTEYILEIMKENGKKDANVLSITNHGQSPGLIALLKGYLKLMNNLNSKIKMLEFVDPAVIDEIIEIEYTYDDIENIDNLAGELAVIPDISDSGEIVAPTRELTKQDIVKQAQTTDLRQNKKEKGENMEVNESDEDRVRKLLYGGNVGQQQQQQPMQGYNPYGGGYPMGFNQPVSGYPPTTQQQVYPAQMPVNPYRQQAVQQQQQSAYGQMMPQQVYGQPQYQQPVYPQYQQSAYGQMMPQQGYQIPNPYAQQQQQYDPYGQQNRFAARNDVERPF